MAYKGQEAKLTYSMAKLLPEDHEISVNYNNFLDKYGAQNIFVIAVEDTQLTNYLHLKEWKLLTDKIGEMPGVNQIWSFTNLPLLVKDSKEKKFRINNWLPENLQSQDQLDSALELFSSQYFYKNLLNTRDNNITALLISLDDEIIRSSARGALIFPIKDIIDNYCKKFEATPHYSGLPYIRTVDSAKVKSEISLFIILTLIVTALILFLFFKSFRATLSSMIVVVLGVLSSFGTIALFQYEITALMALVPPLIIVIGIPNCIFLINKFHTEFKLTKSKDSALNVMIQKIGNITFLTNLTTASGFAAFILTNSQTLQEFGVIASLNIVLIFLLALLIIPIFFSFSPPPNNRHIRHLDQIWVKNLVKYLSYLVREKRSHIYYVTFVFIILGFFGIIKIQTTGNLTDDLPKEQDLYKDLKFLENNFGGVMPVEILVNTKKKNGLLKSYNLKKMEKLQKILSSFSEFSKSSSYIDVLKYSRQSFYNGDSSYYSLPNNQDQRLILSYLNKSSEDTHFAGVLMDSLKQEARFSLRISDISTSRMDSLLGALMPQINEIFDREKYDVVITGISIVFLNGTKFLLGNLMLSLFLVIVLISLFMAWMFNSFRMVMISLIPNILPLLMTGAIMGYFGIALKPSTILVFSIAFGISVDDTIHFLAKYRQELLVNNWNIRKSVFAALEETGVSMFYTSVVLFFGFFIFVASDFGGTVALGLLVSFTLMIAMLSNLLLLPALLLSLERVINYEAFQDPLLEVFDEEEDIELEELKVKKR